MTEEIKDNSLKISNVPLLGQIQGKLGVYYNRRWGQTKYPKETAEAMGFLPGTEIMAYEDDHPGHVFYCHAIEGEKGQKLSLNTKDGSGKHLSCFASKEFFENMKIAVQPPSGRGKDGKGEKGFTILGVKTKQTIRGIVREGLLVNVEEYQEPVHYELEDLTEGKINV